MDSPSNINTSSPTEKYPCPTEFNVLDFVPKLLSDRNYQKWKKLMRGFIKRQGLIGFIDGTAEEEIHNQDYYKAWKKSDNLIQGWILATFSEDIQLRLADSHFETAKDLWTCLEQSYDPASFAISYGEEVDNRLTRCLPLLKAVVKGDLNEVMRIIQLDPDAVRTAITPLSEKALHVAVMSSTSTATAGPGRNDMHLLLLRKLLENMTPHDVVDLVGYVGMTALHYAAVYGTVEVAEMLVNKSPIDLPNALDEEGCTPLHLAARYGRREMVLKLHEFTSQDILTAEKTGSQYLRDLVSGELYGM